MTPPQWEQIVLRVEAAWGKSAKWKGAVAMYEDASRVDYSAATRAVQGFVDSGEAFAPAIPEFLARARSLSKPRKVDTTGCVHPDPAIVERHYEYTIVVCRICGVEEKRQPDMPTVGHLEETW